MRKKSRRVELLTQGRDRLPYEQRLFADMQAGIVVARLDPDDGIDVHQDVLCALPYEQSFGVGRRSGAVLAKLRDQGGKL